MTAKKIEIFYSTATFNFGVQFLEYTTFAFERHLNNAKGVLGCEARMFHPRVANTIFPLKDEILKFVVKQEEEAHSAQNLGSETNSIPP